MDISDFLCNICLGLLIEPVTLPCKHRLCKTCFDRSISFNSLSCPLCKHRISVWCRRQAKNLVDQQLWTEIRQKFPERVNLRLMGVEEDPEELEELFPCVPTHLHVSEGDIGKEFREQTELFRKEVEKEDETKKLIESLLAEEKSSNSREVNSKSSQPVNLKPKSFISNSKPDNFISDPQPSSSKAIISSNEIDKENVFDENLSPEMLEEQREAWLAFEQMKKDEELARQLQLSDKIPSVKKVQTRPGKKKTTTPKSKGQMDRKRFKQLSLPEAFLKNN